LAIGQNADRLNIQVRIIRKPEDCEGARTHRAGDAARKRRQGLRMRWDFIALSAWQRLGHLLHGRTRPVAAMQGLFGPAAIAAQPIC